MLAVPSRPKLESLALQLADQLRGLGTFPQPGVAVLLRTPDPPALPRQPVRLAHDQNCKLRLTALFGFVVDVREHLAKGPHLGPGEMVTEQLQRLGIADRGSGTRRSNQDCPHLRRIGEQPRFAHSGCLVKSTGVSSNTSSLDVLWGHGITSRHL